MLTYYLLAVIVRVIVFIEETGCVDQPILLLLPLPVAVMHLPISTSPPSLHQIHQLHQLIILTTRSGLHGGIYLWADRGSKPSTTNLPVESERQRLYHPISCVNNKILSFFYSKNYSIWNKLFWLSLHTDINILLGKLWHKNVNKLYE